MGFAVVAVVAGIAVGLATGGLVANLRTRPLRAVPALVVAVVLQALPWVAAVLASYVLLLVFAGRNLRLVGMPIVIMGLTLNAVVIAVNGGMPVRPEAIRTVERTADISRVDLGPKRHIEDDDDRLTFLGDIIPVRPFRQVLSFGDLILGVGLANVVFRLLRPA